MRFWEQTQFICNAIVLPFSVSAVALYLYSCLCQEFRSYKFGVTLLVMNYVSVTQITYLLVPPPDPFSFIGWTSYMLQEYSYLLSPLMTWLFSAQYFESASLIVEYPGKQIARKSTGIIFAVVTVLLLV